MESKLALWEANHLSIGGRVTLMKSFLSNLPLYFMSIFKCPVSVVKCIEKLQRDFLCHGRNSGKKFHWVDWASFCKAKVEGGVGIKGDESSSARQVALEDWGCV